jgi:hypothetical protein
VTMPNFFIIGAQKAGTTSLYYYLKQHPQIYMSPRKEPHFFKGMHSEYRKRGRSFPPVTDIRDYQALFEGVTAEKAIGEASASYLYSPKAPALIKRSVPDAKLIAVLRNPADRAYSNFLYCVQIGHEPLASFVEALQAEEKRIRENWGPNWHYRQKGFYYTQVKRYFDMFGQDRIRVYLYDDLKARPFGMLGDIFRFLDVDETFVPDLSIEHNTAGLPRNWLLYAAAKRLASWNPTLKVALVERFLPAAPRRYVKNRIFVKPPPLPVEVRRQLIDLYRDDILQLQDLIQRDLSLWLVDDEDKRWHGG